MSKGMTTEYKHIRLKPADNGFILSYDEVIEKPGTMESRDYREREVVFGDEEADLDAAMMKMKELYLFNKNKKANISTNIGLDVTVKGIG